LRFDPWRPEPAAQRLRDELAGALEHPAVLDLVLFGSQARGGTTGFSDVDAILVITDEAAEDARVLESLRPHVLAAQRAVLAYQPMQHHGFEVATPKLVRHADEALALPEVALAEAKSLRGQPTHELFAMDSRPEGASARVAELVRALDSVPSWPDHPWAAHGLVAMFELLPVLYLQSRGAVVPKSNSFAVAAEDFPRSWWPYNVLEQVRAAWPRRRRRPLEVGAALARNPWLAVAAWRRLPATLPEPVRPLLSDDCLNGLRALARRMGERAA
jgi:hypothetical protein